MIKQVRVLREFTFELCRPEEKYEKRMVILYTNKYRSGKKYSNGGQRRKDKNEREREWDREQMKKQT